MNRAQLEGNLLVFIAVLLSFIGVLTGPDAAQAQVVVNSVAALEAALAAAAAGTGPTDIRIATGTYDIASPLFLDAQAGVTVTLQNAGDGPVILHATQRQDILRTGWNSTDNGVLGPFPGFVVRGLTFSGAENAISSAVGTILVADCTFVDNNLGYYIDFSRGTVTLVNDTFTQNGAGCPSNFFCGGMRFDAHKSSTATNITVVGNQPQGVHGLEVLQNSIVSGNTAPPGFRGADCFDRPQSVSSSIDSDGSCGATTADPQLAALADNGGLVQTMALPAGSPAVNTGNNSVCPATDARGAFRGDGACDIGAFERSRAFEVASLTGAGPVDFATDAGTFTEFHAVDPTTLPPLPGVTFPFGLFEWTISDLTPGATVQVIISFPSPVPVPPEYWKFDPGTGLWADVCQQLPCVTDPSFPNLLQLSITDGGAGDLDGSVNGMIRDPGGLGVSEGGGGGGTLTFLGFEPPITDQALNTGRRGRTYPVKFQVLDASGQLVSDVSAVGSIAVRPVSCATFQGDPTLEAPATATGGTSLRYDPDANQFVFNWQTPGTAGCYQLRVTLADGGIHTANFQLN